MVTVFQSEIQMKKPNACSAVAGVSGKTALMKELKYQSASLEAGSSVSV